MGSSSFRSDDGLTLETSALESLYVANLTLVINSVDKTNIRFYSSPTQLGSFFTN